MGTDGDSPTARALRTLELLHDRPGITAAELGDRLGVSDRAARRYVAILREAGVPVRSDRGPYGGYRLGRGARLPPVSFTAAEALGLVMAVVDARPAAAEVGTDDPVGTALGKVVRVLPEAVRQQASSLRAHTAATPDRYRTVPDPDVTSDLASAVAEHRVVTIDYRTAAGSQWSGRVEPWAVVVRHGHWYLLCRSLRSHEARTYRIDRVRRVEVHTDTFAPPDDLDPVADLERHLGAGWSHPVRVQLDATPEEAARHVTPVMGRLEPHGDGCLLIGTTDNPTMYAGEWLARIPLPFRVLGGPELLAATARLADRLRDAVTGAAPA